MTYIKTIKQNFPLVVGGFFFIFFAFFYQYHLHNQEQLQLFLFTSNVFWGKLKVAGGLSTYLGQFFTQFYYYPLLGAFIIALLLVLLQIVTQKICSEILKDNMFYPLSYLPTFFSFALLCDENYLISGLIALLITAVFMLLYIKANEKAIGFLLIFPILLLNYWFAGGFFYFLSVFIIICLLADNFSIKKLVSVVAIIVVSIILPFVHKLLQPQISFEHLLVGVDFYRNPDEYKIVFLLPAISLVVFSCILYFKKLGLVLQKKNAVVVQAFFLFIVVVFVLVKHADYRSETIMEYDYYARTSQWNKIIQTADNHDPYNPITISLLNLALGKQKLMGEKMFSYYQHGNQCLFPPMERNYETPLITAEIYYHLGLVSIARRQIFEAMECIPQNNKSSRVIKRLAQIAIINGNYPLAEKYLKILGKTLCYKKWASETTKYLYSDSLVEKHPVWGQLRENLVSDNFLISRQEHYFMLTSLLKSNNKNQLAADYLLNFFLLSKDLGNFEISYQTYSKDFQIDTIPKNYQEALALWEQLTNNDKLEQIPYNISPSITQRLIDFSHMLNFARTDKAKIMSYSDTYWYYLKFLNNN